MSRLLNPFSQFKSIYKKEMRDTLRDRRALLALGYFVLGVPVFLMAVFYLLSRTGDEDPVRVLLDGADAAPGLVAFLEKQGLSHGEIHLEGRLPEAMPAGVDAILVLPDDYRERLAEGDTIALALYLNEEGSKSLRRGREVTRAIAAYGGQLASTRLLTRGIPTALLQPFSVTSVDLSENSFIERFTSELLLLMLILAPFTTGMSVAIDVLAGERERSSLELLLAQPVSSLTLVLGKWAAVVSFGFSGLFLMLIILVAEFNLLPSELVQQVPTKNPFILFMLLLQFLPLAMLVAALQMFFSIKAKSFREAQTFLSMVMMVPFILGYMKVLVGDLLPSFAGYMPILADIESASGLFYRETLSLTHFAISLSVSLGGTMVLLWLTRREIESERLLSSN